MNFIIAFAEITCSMMRGRTADFLRSSDRTALTVLIRPLSFFYKPTVIVNLRDGRGHPGYLVRCLETGITFATQADAAKSVGASPQNMSSHLNGRFSDVYGLHFKRISP